jgi:3-deoxy-D-manno-octulosonic-acid transferase
MKDFRDAAELLVEAGGCFQVDSAGALADRILALMRDPESYRLACERAAAAAARQRGALLRQADLVRDMLAAPP